VKESCFIFCLFHTELRFAIYFCWAASNTRNADYCDWWSRCLSICHAGGCVKTAERLDVLFGVDSRGPKKHCIRWGSPPPTVIRPLQNYFGRRLNILLTKANWLGHLACKNRPEIIYKVSSGTLSLYSLTYFTGMFLQTKTCWSVSSLVVLYSTSFHLYWLLLSRLAAAAPGMALINAFIATRRRGICYGDVAVCVSLTLMYCA